MRSPRGTDGAAGTTPEQGPGPTVSAQDGAHLARHQARTLDHVGEAVAQDRVARLDGGVVASMVLPAALVRVRGAAVKLHPHTMLDVVHIVVPPPAWAGAPLLPGRCRQAMGPFNPPQVSALQHRVATPRHVAERAAQLGPPPHPLAGAQRAGDPLGGGKTPPPVDNRPARNVVDRGAHSTL